MQPLSELTEVCFWGLYGNLFIFCAALLWKTLESIIVSLKFSMSFRSENFQKRQSHRTFLRFRNLRPRLFRFLATYRPQLWWKIPQAEQHLNPCNSNNLVWNYSFFLREMVEDPTFFLFWERESQSPWRTECVFWWASQKSSLCLTFLFCLHFRLWRKKIVDSILLCR